MARKFGRRPFKQKHHGITACGSCGCALVNAETGQFKHYSDCQEKPAANARREGKL